MFSADYLRATAPQWQSAPPPPLAAAQRPSWLDAQPVAVSSSPPLKGKHRLVHPSVHALTRSGTRAQRWRGNGGERLGEW